MSKNYEQSYYYCQGNIINKVSKRKNESCKPACYKYTLQFQMCTAIQNPYEHKDTPGIGFIHSYNRFASSYIHTLNVSTLYGEKNPWKIEVTYKVITPFLSLGGICAKTHLEYIPKRNDVAEVAAKL